MLEGTNIWLPTVYVLQGNEAFAAISKMTGPCIRLCSSSYEAIKRLQRLFFLNEGQGLSHFLVQDLGFLRYPSYKIERTQAVFETRDALLEYEGALRLAATVDEALEVSILITDAISSFCNSIRVSITMVAMILKENKIYNFNNWASQGAQCEDYVTMLAYNYIHTMSCNSRLLATLCCDTVYLMLLWYPFLSPCLHPPVIFTKGVDCKSRSETRIRLQHCKSKKLTVEVLLFKWHLPTQWLHTQLPCLF